VKQELTGFQKFKAIIAKWIVVNIACRISPLAVLSLCLEVSRDYYDQIEMSETE
jgi:hypothetical protein